MLPSSLCLVHSLEAHRRAPRRRSSSIEIEEPGENVVLSRIDMRAQYTFIKWCTPVVLSAVWPLAG